MLDVICLLLELHANTLLGISFLAANGCVIKKVIRQQPSGEIHKSVGEILNLKVLHGCFWRTKVCEFQI